MIGTPARSWDQQRRAIAALRRCWCGRPVPEASPFGEVFCAEHDGDHPVVSTPAGSAGTATRKP